MSKMKISSFWMNIKEQIDVLTSYVIEKERQKHIYIVNYQEQYGISIEKTVLHP